MAVIRERPLFTTEYEDVKAFSPSDGSVYLFGVSAEQRSEFATDLFQRCPRSRFVELRDAERYVLETDIAGHNRVYVRRRKSIEGFIRALEGSTFYLDITGLDHSTWAPFIRVFLELQVSLRVVYLEPASYTPNLTPLAGEIFDLSERIEGIEPLPLFTSLEERTEDEICFVPILGFEGVRFSHMIEIVQPDAGKTYPIIGVPGFRPQYPFDAFLGNASPLQRIGSSRNIRFAKSNCPFSLFYTLEDIQSRFPTNQLKVGLIGTKPHAVGAILYALHGGRSVEIIYDHAKRKPGRTRGAARCLVYAVSKFLPLSRIGVV